MSSTEAAPSPAANNSNRSQHLRALLSHSLRRTDTTLLRLSQLLSTPGGIDSTLCTLSYTLTLVHSRLSSRLDSQLRALALSVAEKASDALLPGEAVIAQIPPSSGLQRLARSADATKKLAALISDFRVFVRVWGLLGLYAWGRDTYVNPPADRVVRGITWAQVVVNTLYQALENGAYLASKGVLNSDGWTGEEGAKRQTRWWLWSSRFWAAHVALEFVRLGYLWRKGAEEGRKGEEKEEKVERKTRDEVWWRQTVSNLAYAPLTIHWSLEEGIVSDSWVGFLGMIAGGAGLVGRWKQTAA